MFDARDLAGMGGPSHYGFRIFTTKDGATKYHPRRPAIALDMCNRCIAIYDGCNCGPCYCIPFVAEITAEQLCAIMSTAPDLGTIEGVNFPATICDAMQAAPTLGVLDA